VTFYDALQIARDRAVHTGHPVYVAWSADSKEYRWTERRDSPALTIVAKCHPDASHAEYGADSFRRQMSGSEGTEGTRPAR
jgi:hypothetical protein